MVAGIVAVIAACCCPIPVLDGIMAFLGGAAAVVLAILVLKNGEPGKGMAIAGLATGGFAILFGIPLAICHCIGVMPDFIDFSQFV
jgi:hypothetical protein